MSTLLAIDPGKTTGYAVFSGESLIRFGQIESNSEEFLEIVYATAQGVQDLLERYHCDILAVELPPIPPGLRMPVAAMLGAAFVVGKYKTMILVRPSQKTPYLMVTARRLAQECDPETELTEHIRDAVAVGLIALEQL